MDPTKNYLTINKDAWNNKTETHYTSKFYDTDGFIKGNSSLNAIELNLLEDISNKSLLHLQCHFGQDTISLNRMGAKTTGIDLSDKAIEKAKELAKLTDSSSNFICSDVYNLPNHLNEKFDIVYTSYGTIGWLPDLDKWANIVSHFLKPGGKFVFVEFHPVIWMYDDDFNAIIYSYFKSEPIIEDEVGTYADMNSSIKQQSVSWNHSIGEVITSLLASGLELTSFNEYDYSPYNCLNHMYEIEPKKFRIKKFHENIPLVYSLTAIKK